MLWLYCGLFLSLFGASAGTASTSKREADYTLDETFWNEDSPVGEVERLLREYPQNRELVSNIGAHYYQIIYPVQLRRHEKMGISTREAGTSKLPPRGYGDGIYAGPGRGRTRTGKHFHRTSLLIKAFNHKFRLDLELNTQLLAPNLLQKHFLPGGAEQTAKQEIEHCYYHGTVKDYPGASAAFRTCNGVSGVIHVGNETFVIHPFYGGDMSKHPHVIFEARTKVHKGCGNKGNLEWRMRPYRKQKHTTSGRSRRDVSEVIKYIETALVLDKTMFDKRNGSTRLDVVHDAIQVANIADLYFRTLNTRVAVVYIETWQSGNQAPIDKSQDISRALLNFNDYTSRKLFKVDKDTTQLLTGETFQGGESGMAVPDTVCTAKSVGISVDLNTYEPHLLAGTMAHMIGHNIGMSHDDGREECHCRDWHGCIMAQSIVGLENVQPYKFSECSLADYVDALRIGHGICLLNKPNEIGSKLRSCGNKIVEEGEECDCGPIDECHELDPCCDPITCKLTKEAECATGPCCDNCRLRPRGEICRETSNECDLPEYCSGDNGQCPMDMYKKNGSPCGNHTGYCFNGMCPTLKSQCELIWGYGGDSAELACFEQFNSKGALNGHCGTDANGHFIKCDRENVRCGSLQCKNGNGIPMISGMEHMYSRTIMSISSIEYECKATSGTGSFNSHEVPDMGLVRDGTPCGENLICLNQTCTSLFPYIDQAKCPSNNVAMECSGHGVCTNINRCFCDPGWSGSDCSIIFHPPHNYYPRTTPFPFPPTEADGKDDLSKNMSSKSTPYDDSNNNLSTLSMVFILVGVVKGVFICFALAAVCYRRKSTMPKYDPPYVKKPMVKKFAGKGPSTHNPEEAALENVKRIISFGNMPSYSRQDGQRVLFRPINQSHMSSGYPTNLQEHKLQRLKRQGGMAVMGSASEEEAGHSGEEETVSFIDIAPNNLSKLPEKGILKKPGPYGTVESKEKWSEDSQSDNQEVMSQSDNNLESDGGPITEVERTLKSLNGYHEDILEALRNAASHRGTSATSLSDELRKSISDGYPEYASEFPLLKSSQEKLADSADEDTVPPCGPIRIRNLEDLIRQLEHHSSRHMSPSGSEDIRMSETEADRHYRLESASCTESQGCRREEEPRFVYGRYRHPTTSEDPAERLLRGAEGSMSAAYQEEEIYETADPDRGEPGGTPDSERKRKLDYYSVRADRRY